MNSETWKCTNASWTSFVRFDAVGGGLAVHAFTSDHKGPWVSDGVTYPNFQAARRAFRLPENP